MGQLVPHSACGNGGGGVTRRGRSTDEGGVDGGRGGVSRSADGHVCRPGVAGVIVFFSPFLLAWPDPGIGPLTLGLRWGLSPRSVRKTERAVEEHPGSERVLDPHELLVVLSVVVVVSGEGLLTVVVHPVLRAWTRPVPLVNHSSSLKNNVKGKVSKKPSMEYRTHRFTYSTDTRKYGSITPLSVTLHVLYVTHLVFK